MLPSFPTRDEIPAEMHVDAAAVSAKWLCDGEVRSWTGATAEVRSPVCVRDGDQLERALVGHQPMHDAAAALDALAAARRAWNEGRGAWPSATVAERVGAMERFVVGMRAVREEVVRLLMWEIAKTRKDAESEFDRTVQYIVDTIEALKELDRDAQRFVIEEGFIGQIRRSPFGVALCVGPFNYPLNETFTTLVPALVMGNTVVSKLPRYGGLAQVPLLGAMRRGLPARRRQRHPRRRGDHGRPDHGLGRHRRARVHRHEPRRQHPRAAAPAPQSPALDPRARGEEPGHRAARRRPRGRGEGVRLGALSFNGQRCTAMKLIFVHESIADDFVQRLAAAVDALRPGMPWTPGAQLTPLPEDGKAARLQARCR